ncbi:MAG: hypothetical protein K6E61_02310 [Bacteroidales bacterium]|nr:hypothetical protein [Bacteroidales bacterium]
MAVLSALPLAAQNPPQTPEQQEKQMMEYIDKEVKRLTEILDLEYWQEFYVDSTLTHDYHAMSEEMKKLQTAKVENTDLYLGVQDKWMEQIDATYKRIFNEAQWKKYWKSGGERAQKARNKRKK